VFTYNKVLRHTALHVLDYFIFTMDLALLLVLLDIIKILVIPH